jgi:2-methylcitrate dehydratase PrpD
MALTDRLPLTGGDPDPGSFLDRAAAWATALTLEDVPRPVRQAAAAQLASTVGAAVWTLDHPLGAPIVETVRSRDDGTGSALVCGEESSPAAAARGNAALSMALDFDDTVLGGHTGHSSVFVPLAYAAESGADGRRVLRAQIAANEVAARLASAAAIGPFRGQQTAYIHAVAAAVARAVIEGDDAGTLGHALGTALLQPPWPLEPPFLGADAKVWSASEPIETGLAAVDSARAGLTGAPGIVEAKGGFLEAFADQPLSEFIDGLGERWHTRALTVKSVPGCAYVTAPIEAALAARGRLNRGRTSIERIDVYGSLFTTEVDARAETYVDGPRSPVAALSFSVPFNVAVALADGEHTPRQVGERTRDPEVWELADRVLVHHDSAFTAAALDSEVPVGAMLRRVGLPVVAYAAKSVGPMAALSHLPTLAGFVRKRPLPTDLASADKRMGARVEVTTTRGRTVAATVEHPSGFAGKPLSEVRAVARRKCWTGLAAAGLRESEAKRRADDCLGIADREAVSVSALTGLGGGA